MSSTSKIGPLGIELKTSVCYDALLTKVKRYHPMYNHRSIEKKWQKYWEENKSFKAEIDHSKPKYYVLDMFPYPSGSGLHVGHGIGYTATDIIARYKRQKGFNVLHPMGWDSFGLPAEQYAIRTGTHPATTTATNINNFRSQLKKLGFSYDWDREVATSNPKYYKWTQWIFTKLFERGLAYEADMLVNYCPKLGTVLANEEVENGISKEHGYPIERRPLKQWVLKITEYADRLIADLDQVDWPENLKKLQINWIGRSEGASVDFHEEQTQKSITVFTTRPDTLFGATYMVLAPEHSLIKDIVTAKQKSAVADYQKQAASKSDLERTELEKNKTGVWTGAYAINPVNGEKLPIWVADYVLMGYGTGAIMAVPAHDERDFEFAKKFDIPIKAVYKPDANEEFYDAIIAGNHCWTGEGSCFNSANDEISINDLNVEEAKSIITKWLEKKGKGKFSINYKLRDWLFSRQRYWGEPFPILHLEDGTKRSLELNELPLCPPDVTDFKPSEDGTSPLSKCKEWLEITDPKTGKKALRETNTMPQWAGSCWYYLRFCDPTNDSEAWSSEAEKYWLPVDLYIGGVEHAVLHLLYARFWHKVLYDCGLVTTLEPFQKLRNQGLITSRSFQKEGGSYVATDDISEKNGEYFHNATGEKLRSQVEKMSKSKLNGVIPDDITEEFGADALRMYEMFMGPLEKETAWNTDAVSGCRRFLSRFHDMSFSDKATDNPPSEQALKLGYRLLDGAMRDVENLQFNTAIAKMMEFINEFTKLPEYPNKVIGMVTQVLSWFAPHLAEEIWAHLGNTESIIWTTLPKVQEKYIQEETSTYVVQVNGKLRGRFELPKDQTKDIIIELAQSDETISRHLQGEIKKVIFVPNKLINFVL
jgi:leucyl-tRNA synthetase